MSNSEEHQEGPPDDSEGVRKSADASAKSDTTTILPEDIPLPCDASAEGHPSTEANPRPTAVGGTTDQHNADSNSQTQDRITDLSSPATTEPSPKQSPPSSNAAVSPVVRELQSELRASAAAFLHQCTTVLHRDSPLLDEETKALFQPGLQTLSPDELETVGWVLEAQAVERGSVACLRATHSLERRGTVLLEILLAKKERERGRDFEGHEEFLDEMEAAQKEVLEMVRAVYMD